MRPRVNFSQRSPELAEKLSELDQLSRASGLGRSLIDLVNLRASLLNGCAFCVDLHAKQAKLHGERELRVYHVGVWRESPLFSDRERAALEWTEAVTQLPPHGIEDALYARVREQFSEREISDLTFAIGVINFWNRLAVSLRSEPGSADAELGVAQSSLS